jgi:hypothetical protein
MKGFSLRIWRKLRYTIERTTKDHSFLEMKKNSKNKLELSALIELSEPNAILQVV